MLPFRVTTMVMLGWVLVAYGIGQLGVVGKAHASELFPTLMIQPHTLDMGTIIEGKKAKGELLLRNNGEIPLVISHIQTSCGCTTGTLDERLLPPGGFTMLHVKVDTFAKRGKVKKEIWVSDDAGHTAIANLQLTVRPNPHMHMGKRSIFDARCAACHADPARGKNTGPEIFAAVCAMCHGDDAKGGYAPSLRGRHDAASLASLINNGAGNHYMPGFTSSRGGPLSPAQVQVLSQWLASLH